MVVIVGIAYLSLSPTDTITVGNDKISHFIAYSVLSLHVGLLTFEVKKQFVVGMLLCLVYGALIEVIQHFVPGRFMSGYDMIANAIGVFLGLIITAIAFKPISKILKLARII